MGSINSPLWESSLSQDMLGEHCDVGHIEYEVMARLEVPICVMQKCCPLSLLRISNGFLLLFPLPPTSVLPQNKFWSKEIDRRDRNSQLSVEQGNYTWREVLIATETSK